MVSHSRVLRTLSIQVLCISKDGYSATSMDRICSSVQPCSRKKVSSLFLNDISCILVCAYCFLPCHWASLRRIWLPLLYSYHQVFIQWIIFQKALSEPGRMVPALLACLHQTDAPRAYSSLWYFTGLASMHICLPFAREPGTGPTSRYVSPGEEKDQLS